MKRLCVLLCALICALCLASGGCQSEDGKGFFDAAVKDWNGDNMKMKGFREQ
jgi:hypothetical protein